MELYDEDLIKKNQEDKGERKKIIILILVILIVLIFILLGLIAYLKYSSDEVSVYVNTIENQELAKLIDFQKNEYGETQIYIPIMSTAKHLGYESYNGNYVITSEDKNSCHVKNQYEVAIYTLNSKTIYKYNLEEEDSEYEYSYLDKKVFQKNGELYTTIDGMCKGYNIQFEYDEKNKTINIYTLDYLITLAEKVVEDAGYKEIYSNRFNNNKTILDNMIVVKNKEGKCGVIEASTTSVMLGTQYDDIEYIEQNSEFLVTSNQKQGVISKEGITRIETNYDLLSLIDKDHNFYLAKNKDLYGILQVKPEETETIINIENDKVGVDIKDFTASGIKSGYILLNKLIPVEQEDKWAFFDISGKQITDFIYDKIGCTKNNTKNVYSLLEVPNYNVLVIGKGDTYTFMDIEGNDDYIPCVLKEIYMQVSSGKQYFKMVKANDEKVYDVIEYLEKSGLKSTV